MLWTRNSVWLLWLQKNLPVDSCKMIHFEMVRRIMIIDTHLEKETMVFQSVNTRAITTSRPKKFKPPGQLAQCWCVHIAWRLCRGCQRLRKLDVKSRVLKTYSDRIATSDFDLGSMYFPRMWENPWFFKRECFLTLCYRPQPNCGTLRGCWSLMVSVEILGSGVEAEIIWLA